MTTSSKPGPRAPLPFLGLACAIGVSTIYYNQPLLLEMGHSYGATAGHTGFVAVATQVGYAVGLLTFVPLGDVLERRRLILTMLALLSISLIAATLAPTLLMLSIASLLIGITSVILAMIASCIKDVPS